MISKKWMFVCAALLCACGVDKDKNATNNAANQASADMGSSADEGGEQDLAENVTPNNQTTNNTNGSTNNVVDPGECTSGIADGMTIDLDPGDFAGQFYARTAWDGQGAWVVYNRRDSTGPDAPEEIFAVRVGCDGTVGTGPLQLSVGNGARNYMPVIASRGGVTHVAWVEEGNNPERIWLQMLSDEGETLLAEPSDITPSVAGVPVSTLIWEPDIAVWEDGTGVIAANAGGFGDSDVVLQRYDSTGTPSGDALTPYPEEGVDQKRPTLAADPDGTVYLGWTRYKPADGDAGTPEEPERAVFTSIPAGANMIFPAAPLPAKPLTTPNPIARYSREPGPGGAFYLAFQVTESSRQDILVRDGTDFETASTGAFGSSGWANFRPSVAAGKAGGVLAWYRYNQTPLENVVMLHPFAFDGTFTPGSELVIETETPGVPPYGPDITWAGGSVYFVVWGEGNTAPEARVKGRWVLL